MSPSTASANIMAASSSASDIGKGLFSSDVAVLCDVFFCIELSFIHWKFTNWLNNTLTSISVIEGQERMWNVCIWGITRREDLWEDTVWIRIEWKNWPKEQQRRTAFFAPVSDGHKIKSPQRNDLFCGNFYVFPLWQYGQVRGAVLRRKRDPHNACLFQQRETKAPLGGWCKTALEHNMPGL